MSEEVTNIVRQFETACQQLVSPTLSISERQNIESSLISFQNNPQSWRLCLQMMSLTTNTTVLFYIQGTYEVLLKKYWNTLSSEDKVSIRSFEIQHYYDHFNKYPENLSNKIAKIIAWIGEYEWPQDFPDFLQIIAQGLQNETSLDASILLLNIITEEIYNDSIKQPILTYRKKELKRCFRVELQNIIKQLNDIIIHTSEQNNNNNGLSNTRWMYCLHILLTILQNNKIEETLSTDLINILLLSLYKYQTQESIEAIKCISEILSKRLIPLNSRVFIFKLIQSISQLLQCLLGIDMNTVNPLYIIHVNRLLLTVMSNGLVILLKNKEFKLLEFLQLFMSYTYRQLSPSCFLLCLQTWTSIYDTLFMRETIQETSEYIPLFITLRDRLVQSCLSTGSPWLFDVDSYDEDEEEDDEGEEEKKTQTTDIITGEIEEQESNYEPPSLPFIKFNRFLIKLLSSLTPLDPQYPIHISSLTSSILSISISIYKDIQTNNGICNTPQFINSIKDFIFLLDYLTNVEHLLPSSSSVIQVFEAISNVVNISISCFLHTFGTLYLNLITSSLTFFQSLLRWVLCNQTTLPNETKPMIPAVISMVMSIIQNTITPFPISVYYKCTCLLRGIPERLHYENLWDIQDTLPLYTSFLPSTSSLPLYIQEGLFLFILKSLSYPPQLDEKRLSILTVFLTPFVDTVITTDNSIKSMNINIYSRCLYLLSHALKAIRLESKSVRQFYHNIILQIYSNTLTMVKNITSAFYMGPSPRLSFTSLRIIMNSLLIFTDWILNTPSENNRGYNVYLMELLSLLPNMVISPDVKLRDELFIVKYLHLLSLFVSSPVITLEEVMECMYILYTLNPAISQRGNITILNEYIQTNGNFLKNIFPKDFSTITIYKDIPINIYLEKLLETIYIPITYPTIPPDTCKIILSLLTSLCMPSFYKNSIYKLSRNAITSILLPDILLGNHAILQDDIILTIYRLFGEDLNSFYTPLLSDFISSIQQINDQSKQLLFSTIIPVKDPPSFTTQISNLINDLYILKEQSN
ncbi:hypothetical protein WA158_001520 [Blastocystis sp. Blastoise]